MKPCPFCGATQSNRLIGVQPNGYSQKRTGDPDRDKNRIPSWYEGACYRCDFVGPGFDTEQEAINHWNTRALPAVQPVTGDPVTLAYTNWRGETAQRTIVPQRVWFGSTDWHPEPQWLLTALDAEKGADRDFALKDFGNPAVQPGPRRATGPIDPEAGFATSGAEARWIADIGAGVYDDAQPAPWPEGLIHLTNTRRFHVDCATEGCGRVARTRFAGRDYCEPCGRKVAGAAKPDKINWRDDPDAIVEDDEPQIGRDYA
jgi:hypothetical protein